MRVTATVSGGIGDIMAAEQLAAEMAVTAGISRATLELQRRWRAQVKGAGLGIGLTKAIRSKSWPQGTESLDAAGLVWARSAKIIDAFDRGALIRSQSDFWLAIPTPAAGRGPRGKRMTPAQWENRTGRRLRMVYRQGRNALLVDDGAIRPGNVMVRVRARRGGYKLASPRGFRNRTVVIFTLVRQVKLPKKLDLDRDVRAVEALLPGHIVASWRRQ